MLCSLLRLSCRKNIYTRTTQNKNIHANCFSVGNAFNDEVDPCPLADKFAVKSETAKFRQAAAENMVKTIREIK